MKERDTVAKNLKGKADIEDSLSNNGDNVVQTTKRFGRPRKGVKKLARADVAMEPDVVLSSLTTFDKDVIDHISKFRRNKTDMKDSLSETEDDVVQTPR